MTIRLRNITAFLLLLFCSARILYLILSPIDDITTTSKWDIVDNLLYHLFISSGSTDAENHIALFKLFGIFYFVGLVASCILTGLNIWNPTLQIKKLILYIYLFEIVTCLILVGMDAMMELALVIVFHTLLYLLVYSLMASRKKSRL